MISAVYSEESVNCGVVPSFVRRGGCATKKYREASITAQTGWSLTSHAVVSDHPVRSTKEASQHFHDVAATPPHEEGTAPRSTNRPKSKSSPTTRGWRVVPAVGVAILLFGLFLTSCARPATPDSSAKRTFTLGITSGAQEFVDFVMEGHGLLDQVGLKPEKVKSLSPANLHIMVAERKVDIGFGGFTTMATARSEGKDIIVIYGVFSPVNMVFVRKDSPIKTLTDLKGKKLGVFGGPGSTTFAFLAVLAKNFYGIDLFHDAELVTAPAPALVELLGRGEVDAALVGTVESVQTFAQNRYRVLADLSAEYKAHQGGRAPAHVVVATNEEFAKTHPDIVRDYLKAYKNGLQYVHDHPEVWDEYASSIKMDNPSERALLREKMAPNLVEHWDADQIALQNDYLKLVHSIIGDSVLKVVPTDLIRNDYTP
jgi:NitT/TauT family transport system substrate-binding protein